MPNEVNPEPFVPETVKHIRFLVLGNMSNKVLVEPTADLNIGFYTEDPQTQELSYTGTFPALVETERYSSNISYAPTGLDNLGRSATIFSGAEWTAQSRIFTVADEAVVPNASGLAFKVATGIGLSETLLFVVELMNADKRVIGRKMITAEDSDAGAIVQVVVDNYYSHSKPEDQGLSVTVLNPTPDPSATVIDTAGVIASNEIFKVTVPAGKILNLLSYFPAVTNSSQSATILVYGEDGRIHARHDISTDAPFARTLPIFATDKTLYISVQGGVFNQSRRTFSRDFVNYGYGQLQDNARVMFQLLPVIEFPDLTQAPEGQESARARIRITQMPEFSVDVDGTPVWFATHSLWGKFTLTQGCDRVVISSRDPEDPDIADTMIALFDENGAVVRTADNYDAISYSDDMESMEATLKYDKLPAGTYYFATFLEAGGISNSQSLDDMDSPNYTNDEVYPRPAFSIYSVNGNNLPMSLLLSVEVFPDNSIYIDNSKNGCTIAALTGQKFVLRNNPLDPFTRSFKCRFLNLEDGASTVYGDPGFRDRYVRSGEIYDQILTEPVTLQKKGDWVDVVYDDKAEAFQVAGVGRTQTSAGSWVGTLEFDGTLDSEYDAGPGGLSTIYPIEWFDTLKHSAGFADGTRFTFSSMSFQSIADAGARRYEVSVTAQLEIGSRDPDFAEDELDTDRTIDLELVLDGYPFVRSPLVLSQPAIAPSRNLVADGMQVYDFNSYRLTLSGTCMVTTLDDLWYFNLRNPYADRTISFNRLTISIREVPLETANYAPALS